MVTTIDKTSLLAEVSGGARLADVEADLRKEGLTLDLHATDPVHDQTIAEWLARGGPGARDGWLDPADHLVAGLDATLKNGTAIHVRPGPRRAVGPDLIALFVGTRGRYGAITSAWVRVHRLGVARPSSPAFNADRNPAMTSEEEALSGAIERELTRV